MFPRRLALWERRASHPVNRIQAGSSGLTRVPSHSGTISHCWPNPPPAETNTEPHYGTVSQGDQPVTWANWLLWIPSTWGVCVTVGQKFILSRTDSYSHYEFAFPIHSSPSSTTIQEFTKWSPIDVVSHTILLKSNGPMLTAKRLHRTIRITGLITYLRQPNEMAH